MASLYGDDPGVTCHCFLAMSLWFLGYPDRALANVREALSVAREIGSPYCETFALDFVTWIHVLRREEGAAEASIAALCGSRRSRLPCLCRWGLARSLLPPRRGGRRVRQCAADRSYEATGAVMSRPVISFFWRGLRQDGTNAEDFRAGGGVRGRRATVERLRRSCTGC